MRLSTGHLPAFARRRRGGGFLVIAYLCWIALLTACTIVSWTRPFAAHAAGELSVGRTVAPISAGPKDRLDAAFAQRPLFTPSRRPSRALVQAQRRRLADRAVGTPDAALALKATMLSERDAVAVVADRMTGDLAGLRTGHRVAGWRVAEIGAAWIRLARGGEQRILYTEGHAVQGSGA